MHIPEQVEKPPFHESLGNLHRTLDPLGFIIFAGAAVALLLAISWGGATYSWSSPIILRLLCASFGLTILLGYWILRLGEAAIVPPTSLRHRSVNVGSILMFLQAGATQMIPYYLPLWFQAILGNSPVESALQMLPSIISNILALITFGALGEYTIALFCFGAFACVPSSCPLTCWL